MVSSPRSQLSPRSEASVDSSWTSSTGGGGGGQGGDGSVTVGGESTHKSVATFTSIIGHDDPTLVHTNINNGNGDDGDSLSFSGIRSTMTNATLGSLVSAETSTATPTRENRDATTTRDGSGSASGRKIDELEERLNELDRTVQLSVESMDSTGAFYVDEAGAHHSTSSPRNRRSHRPTGFSLEQTIVEEEHDADEQQLEQEKQNDQQQRDGSSTAAAAVAATSAAVASYIPFSRTAQRAAERSKRSESSDPNAQSTPHLVASSKTTSAATAGAAATEKEPVEPEQEGYREGPPQLDDDFEDGIIPYENSLEQSSQSYDQNEDQYNVHGVASGDDSNVGSDDNNDVERLGYFNSEEASIGDSGEEESSIMNSNDSDLVYTYPSSVDNSDDDGGIPLDPVQRTYDNEMVRPRPDEDPEDNSKEIVREVQRRLYDRSSSINNIDGNKMTPTELPLGDKDAMVPSYDQRKPGFKDWIPVGDGSVRTSHGRSGVVVRATPSGDNSNADDTSRLQNRRRRRLCILNLLVCTILAAVIVLVVFLVLNLTSRSSTSSASTGSLSSASPTQKTTQQPTTTPLSVPTASPVNAAGPSDIVPAPVESPTALQPVDVPSTPPPPSLDEATAPTTAPTQVDNLPSPVESPTALQPVEVPSTPPPPSLAEVAAPTNSPTQVNNLPSPVESPTAPRPADVPSTPSSPVAVSVPTGSPTQVNDLPSTTQPGQNPTADSVGAPTQSPTANEPTLKPTSATLAPTVPIGLGEKRVLEMSGDAIYDESTPQFKAWEWLSNNDPASLDLNNISDVELSQRYISALFYFSLGGEKWFNDLNFLSETNVCEWNNGAERNPRGIICNNLESPTISFTSQFEPTVTAFSINQNNLKGQLPTELLHLSGLKSLKLRGNKITGQVPAFQQLRFLDELRLNDNDLTGDLTSIVCNLRIGDVMAPITRGDDQNPIDTFVTDCLGPQPKVSCECCTSCCNSDNVCRPN